MRTLTATDLKTRTGDFFDALLADGEVRLTRNGRAYPVRLIVGSSPVTGKLSLREALYDPVVGGRDFKLPERLAKGTIPDLGLRDE